MPSAFPQLMRIFYKFQESREQKCSCKHFKDVWKRERYSDGAMVPASRKQPSFSASIFICCPHLHTRTLSVCVCSHWALPPTNGTLLIFILLRRLHHLMNPLTHCLFSVFCFRPLELFPTWCLRHPSCCTLRRLRKEEMIKSLI